MRVSRFSSAAWFARDASSSASNSCSRAAAAIEAAAARPPEMDLVAAHGRPRGARRRQRQPFDLLFFAQSVTTGNLNAALSISDADALHFRGRVQVLASDYYDVGNAAVADVAGTQRYMATAAGARSMWVAGVSRGTATYGSASALQLVFNVMWPRGA